MRVRRSSDPEEAADIQKYVDYLMEMGDGKLKSERNGYISLPDDVCVPSCNIDDLVDRVFPNLPDHINDSNWISERAILATTNDMARKINQRVMKMLPGETVLYESADSALDDTHSIFPTEFLNTLQLSGMPAHKLELKINTPILLMRNLDIINGLCNGTRLIVKGLMTKVIDAEIVTGTHAGKRVFIPRIPIIPSEHDGVCFKRVQFPVMPAFAMTINKAQGQTLNSVGVYLNDSVFSHGQLYVAMSRVTNQRNMHVMIVNDDGKPSTKTKNIVYHEILQ